MTAAATIGESFYLGEYGCGATGDSDGLELFEVSGNGQSVGPILQLRFTPPRPWIEEVIRAQRSSPKTMAQVRRHDSEIGNELVDYKAKEGGIHRKSARYEKCGHPSGHQAQVQVRLEDHPNSHMGQGSTEGSHPPTPIGDPSSSGFIRWEKWRMTNSFVGKPRTQPIY